MASWSVHSGICMTDLQVPQTHSWRQHWGRMLREKHSCRAGCQGGKQASRQAGSDRERLSYIFEPHLQWLGAATAAGAARGAP